MAKVIDSEAETLKIGSLRHNREKPGWLIVFTSHRLRHKMFERAFGTIYYKKTSKNS